MCHVNSVAIFVSLQIIFYTMYNFTLDDNSNRICQHMTSPKICSTVVQDIECILKQPCRLILLQNVNKFLESLEVQCAWNLHPFPILSHLFSTPGNLNSR